MPRVLALPAGRRAKWLVAAVWLAALVASVAFNLPGRFADAEENESASFLPGDAESTTALELQERLVDGEKLAIVVVYHHDGGLTTAARAAISTDRAELDRLELPRTSAFGSPIVSEDGTGALITAEIMATESSKDPNVILDPVDAVRERVSDPPGGLEAKVTGPAASAADAIKIFEDINGTLLLAAVSLVIFLLIIVYRSPLFWIFPVIAVLFAELAARSVGYGLTEIGVTVNGQSSAILSVLVLGAGTDYALLLVARYREELGRHGDRHEAMALALRTAGPAIVASGATVVAALLCLTLADVNGTAGLGPIGALGVAVAVVAMLTFLPALLTIVGPRVMWPRVPQLGDAGADVTHGAWRRVGDRVARRPRRVWLGTAALLLGMSLGLLNLSDGLTQADAFRGEVESAQGQELVAESFPAGTDAPTDVIVPDPARAAAVRAAVAAAPGVASVRPVARGEEGVLLNAVLTEPPGSEAAFELIPGIRAAAKAAGGPGTVVGGASAIERDLRVAAARDTRLIIPVALAVVFLILVLLLRALVAPLLLIATVILSFAAALGVGAVVFDVIFGFPGSEPSLPLFAFIFLVALGIDYNIFLMARVREETRRHGTRQGMLRGLAVTGGVITSAGVVLAGTFSVLGVLPLVFLTQIGFVVAFGVLLDTFVVRSVLVPALTLDVGRPIWWPSALDARSRSAADVTAPSPAASGSSAASVRQRMGR